MAVIQAFVGGRNVFVALPGFGKSHCFGFLPTVFDCLCDCVDKASLII